MSKNPAPHSLFSSTSFLLFFLILAVLEHHCHEDLPSRWGSVGYPIAGLRLLVAEHGLQ